MATDKKISEENRLSSMSDTTLIPAVSGGENWAVTGEVLRSYNNASAITELSLTYPDGEATERPVIVTTKGSGEKTIHMFPRAGNTTTGVVMAEDFERFDKAANRSNFVATGYWVAGNKDTAEGAPRLALWGIVDEKEKQLCTLPEVGVSTSGVLTFAQYNALVGLKDEAKRELFDELWLAATMGTATPYGGSVDHSRGGADYGVNGLWLTYEEAKVAYNNRKPNGPYGFMKWQYCRQRTNIPMPGPSYLRGMANMFSWSTQLEVAYLGNMNINKSADDAGANRAFAGCTNLRRIVGYICPTFTGFQFPATFSGCKALEEVQINFSIVKVDVGFEDSPLLSLESLQYLVANAKADATACTVTVHADVYGKLIDSAGYPQWNKVLTDGAAKNITFAKA